MASVAAADPPTATGGENQAGASNNTTSTSSSNPPQAAAPAPPKESSTTTPAPVAAPPATTTPNAPTDNWAERGKPKPRDVRVRTEDVTKTRGTTFDEFFLKRELLVGIYDMGFEVPSPIQEESIPLALAGRNILARAKNGTGKTAAFVIPMLEKVNTAQRTIQGLVLVPTRELALQTSSVVKDLGKHMGIQCMVSTGGTSLREDILRLYNPVHILVATPGRILDLANKQVSARIPLSLPNLHMSDRWQTSLTAPCW